MKNNSFLRHAKRVGTGPVPSKATQYERVSRGSPIVLKLSLELFTEIAGHLTPEDLLALIRTSKSFRKILLRRSAALAWRSAQSNVPGLPPCPTGMSEPQYAALLFTRICTICARYAPARPDPYLRARLCAPCRDNENELKGLRGWMFGGAEEAMFVPKSFVIKPKLSYTTVAYRYFCLRRDLDQARDSRQALLVAGDEEGLKAWETRTLAKLEVHNEEAKVIQKYLDNITTARSDELYQAKQKRSTEIHKRLRDLGWKDSDFSMSGENGKEWRSLVDIKAPLSDSTWKLVLPRLTRLLEANRVEQARAQKWADGFGRREHLHKLLGQFKKDTNPYRSAIAGLDLDPTALENTTSHFQGPFPDTSVAFEWDCLRSLHEQDVTIERLEELFLSCRDQVQAKVSKWGSEIEQQLVERYITTSDNPRRRRPNKDTIVTIRGSTDLTRQLPDHTRFLLRADTVFMVLSPRARSEFAERRPITEEDHRIYETYASPKRFPSIASANYWGYTKTMDSKKKSDEVPLVELHGCYTAGVRLVQRLLREINMPDAAYMELWAMGKVFICERCKDPRLQSWEDLVSHYHFSKSCWEKDKKKYARFAVECTYPATLQYFHNLDLAVDSRPLVRHSSPEEVAALTASRVPAGQTPNEYWCFLCRFITEDDCGGSMDWIIEHLRDFHAITEPVAEIHFTSKRRPTSTQRLSQGERWKKAWKVFHGGPVKKRRGAARVF